MILSKNSALDEVFSHFLLLFTQNQLIFKVLACTIAMIRCKVIIYVLGWILSIVRFLRIIKKQIKSTKS